MMQGDLIGRQIGPDMVFYAYVVVETRRSFPDKSPLPSHVEIATFSIGSAGYPCRKCSIAGIHRKYIPFEMDIGYPRRLMQFHAGRPGNIRKRRIEPIAADPKAAQR